MTISYEAQFKETKTKMEGCEFYRERKGKWVGWLFPQIVYQLHKLATNYPTLTG